MLLPLRGTPFTMGINDATVNSTPTPVQSTSQHDYKLGANVMVMQTRSEILRNTVAASIVSKSTLCCGLGGLCEHQLRRYIQLAKRLRVWKEVRTNDHGSSTRLLNLLEDGPARSNLGSNGSNSTNLHHQGLE